MTTSPDNNRPAVTTPVDPFDLWRQVYEANERAWSSALEKAMAAPAFAQTQGKLLETLLHAQKAARDNMRTYLESINVPTREDVARLGELIVGLEEKIDQLGDRLERLEDVLVPTPEQAKGPPRGDTNRSSPV